MLEIFPDGPVSEYPQLINILFSFFWTFFLASAIGLVHRFTYNGNYYPASFFQALVLGSLVTTLIMMAIGDSLARGLGVFGAMAIIRFSTRIGNPRDVIFLFASLSVGLSIGVFGFAISFIGTLLFCSAALLFNQLTLFKAYGEYYIVRFSIEDPLTYSAVLLVINKYSKDTRQISAIVKNGLYKFELTITALDGQVALALLEEIKSIPTVHEIQVTLKEEAV